MHPLFRKIGMALRWATDWTAYRMRPDSLRPDFFILGGQKCGTTALAHFLSLHPDVFGVKDKEAHFFHRDAVHRRGQQWYARQFPGVAALRPGARLFDATPIYLYYPGTAERIRAYAPEARLLVMLRDPVPRAWSAYAMDRNQRENHREHTLRKILLDANPEQRDPMVRLFYAETFPSFAEAVEAELALIQAGDSRDLEPSYVRRGLFAEQLERYFNVFPRDRFLIIEDRELRQDRAAVMRRVGEFLGLRARDWQASELTDRNVRRYQETPDPEVLARLYEFYRPHNERLSALLGRRFAWGPSD